MPSLTNVSFPEELTSTLQAAVKHYGFENLAQFFRVSGHALIQHHKRKDTLTLPLAFETRGDK